jgi:ABC-type antimicrobial peptide transport system permease subunit
VRGRGITAADEANAPRVAVVNDEMAKRFWPNQEAIGKTFSTDSETYRVVGVTRTAKVRTLGEAPRPFIMVSLAQEFSATEMLIARTNGDADRVAAQMLAVLREIDPSLMAIQVKTMERHLAAMLLPARLGALAFSLFAGLALGLAVLGVYGVVGYAVARRTREAGIRLAVGAQPRSIVRLLMAEGVTLVAAGSVIGLLLGFASSQVLGNLLFGVGKADPLTFIGAPLVLAGAGLLAAFLPARRAGRIDPAKVLRGE